MIDDQIAFMSLAWLADKTGYIYWYNPDWYRYTGTTPEQMEGWGWVACHHPDTLQKVLAEWTDCVAKARPFEMIFPLRGADGTFRPFLTRCNPVIDKSGDVTGWIGGNIDVSGFRSIPGVENADIRAAP